MSSKKSIAQMDFGGNSNIGLFSFSTDLLCVIGKGLTDSSKKLLKDILDVEIIESSFLGTDLAGIFVSGNSNGLIVSSRLEESEIELLKKHSPVLVIETKYTALGNLILANDKGCIISKEIKNLKKKISGFLKVPVEIGTIGEMDLVGSLGICNNKGCIVHKSASPEEIKHIRETLGVPADTGTVNFGSGWMRSGVLTNTNGFLAGKKTSGPEMGNIAEVLGFV